MFHSWWEYARIRYLSFDAGKPGGKFTLYYDPLIDFHYQIAIGGALGVALQIAPLKRQDALQLLDAAATGLGWRTLDPIRDINRDRTTGEPTPWGNIVGLALARELGDDELYSKLKAHAEANYEPTWDEERGEFTWGFGLKEPYPRGQYNAVMMTSECGGDGALGRLTNEPNLRKFIDPTVYGVDFPRVCLSQASYDPIRRVLVIATDAGLPSERGKPTWLKVTNIDPAHCEVVIDGQKSEAWKRIGLDIEVQLTIGEHTMLIWLR